MRRGRRLGPVAILVMVVALPLACGGEDDPRALLEEAAAKRIESAQVALKLDFKLDGLAILGPSTTLEAEGPVSWVGPGRLPEADLDARVRGGGDSIPARVIAADDRLFVEFMRRPYEADPALVGWLSGAGDGGGGGGEPGVSLEELLGGSPADWLRGLELRDGEEIGGDDTREITGSVNVSAAATDLLSAFRPLREEARRGGRGGGNGLVAALGELSLEELLRLSRAIEKARVVVNVDDEGHPRRVLASWRFRMPEGIELEGIEGGRVSFEMVLRELGAKVRVAPPPGADDFADLLRFVGLIFGIEALERLGS